MLYAVGRNKQVWDTPDARTSFARADTLRRVTQSIGERQSMRQRVHESQKATMTQLASDNWQQQVIQRNRMYNAAYRETGRQKPGWVTTTHSSGGAVVINLRPEV